MSSNLEEEEQKQQENEEETDLNLKRKLNEEAESEPNKKQIHFDPAETQLSLFNQLKLNLCAEKFKNITSLSSLVQNSLAEQYFLEQNLAYIDFEKWKQIQLKNPSPIVQTYLNENFDAKSKQTDLDTICQAKFNLNESLIQPDKSSISSILLAKPSSEQAKSIAERAKHEAQILQRIAQLRKEGLWSIKRLPKLVEPTRPKTHWDYLLDEMVWMSTDFQQERKWKINTSKKIALSIQKYFKDKEVKAEQMEREEQKRLKKQAQLVAKEVQQFWKQVEKIIEYKQKTLFEQKRKQQMDKHLNFIVDQTEKYSSWLMQSLSGGKVEESKKEDEEEAEEFELKEDEFDNESTIESEEDQEKVNDEIEKLKMESELSLDDLLKDYNLDGKYFEKQEQREEEEDLISEDESDQDLCSEDMSVEEDDEETIEQDEKFMSSEYDAEKELAELREDFSLPIDQLLAKLTDPTKESDSKEKEIKTQQETSQLSPKTSQEDQGNREDNALNSIAAQAQSLQPTGYTLQTTNVKTPVPSLLLKHNLREYQHVGLDWLVTMYENKLNGILADEMGLGKTIQTIALLAHLAVEKAIWGPHLIVVPTSVMLNWELEFKKWCPGFKILTYYGSPKERRLKRQGWTKVNAFHVCITSYKLVIQDHSAFRRKKWKYFILDEAQNIKNFKSQRWQSLLNFQSQRRLLLTGTPLQNNLMELWSLMHFLMPHVFSSHREFQHWFSNPLKCMIEGNQEYNEQLIKRLHKVLRPFILRRLKIDVEKQMPKKYEHVIKCKLSKRQRLLYDEFMSLSSTKEKLAEGRYMSVINILMQLRKVCNHPDLFDPRPIVSSFVCDPLQYQVPSLVFNLSEEIVQSKLENMFHYGPGLADVDICYSAFDCHRSRRLQTPKKLIEEIMNQVPELPVKQTSFHPSNSFLEKVLTHSNEPEIEEDLSKFFYGDKTEGLSLVDSEQWHKRFKSTSQTDELRLKNKIQYLTRLNRLRCQFLKPMYGTDLQECIGPREVFKTTCEDNYFGTSYSNCQNALNYTKQSFKMNIYWSQSEILSNLVNYIKNILFNPKQNHEYLDILNRFVLYVPNVRYSTKMNSNDLYENSFLKLNIPKPNVCTYDRKKVLIQELNELVRPSAPSELTSLEQIVDSQMCTQFPEKRLIQYDCGKLQTMSELLRQLYSESHRVLIFTQMTRMLDVLENFLNYHGYKYLRLDGSTSIEQRQALMERFNNDKRIFCFILSTRSGGIGVNLTGADTVVFYDSDWNPTMDAQAQDRCHRIGQTRDVHIYRLISEKTVEENILKKANQKRLLSEMTIEGGCFTTAVLRKHHITELFDEDEETEQSISGETVVVPTAITNKESESQFEEALALVEDESDVQAAKELKEEVKQDILEFDENELNINSVNSENPNETTSEMNKIENEFKLIETELKPIERYALKFLESYGEVITVNQEQEIEIEQVKKDWELNRLKQLKEEEERKAEQEENDMMFTYTKTEIWINENAEQMPLWCPLTPPMHESDVFIDTWEPVTSYLYDTEPIPESLLPPVFYAKRGEKRIKLDSSSSISPAKKQNNQNLATTLLIPSNPVSAPVTAAVTPPAITVPSSTQAGVKALVKMENIIIPRPLFDKANTALIKLRRDIKMQKLKGWPTFKLEIIKSTLPIQPEFNFGKDDWLPNDDYIILHTLQVILELPLNLQLIAPAHLANWDLISDLVSSNNSKYYRSPSDCKKRFETVILKREEMCLTEIQNKKQQLALQQQQAEQQSGANKTKQANKPTPLNICKTKTLRTNQLFVQDNFKTLMQNQKRRFDKINSIAKKRHPSQFALGASNPQHQQQLNNLQKQSQFEHLLARFNPNQSSFMACTTSTVINAMNAVAFACKQQQIPGQAQQSQITAESIQFKTPKYFADLKQHKERQSKLAAAVASNVTQPSTAVIPTTPTPKVQQSPQQTAPTPATPPQAVKTQNQAILSHLQQQKATSVIAAQLAATAAAVAAASSSSSPQQQQQQQQAVKASSPSTSNTNILKQQQQQAIPVATISQAQTSQTPIQLSSQTFQQIQANFKQSNAQTVFYQAQQQAQTTPQAQRSVSTEILNQSNLRSLVQNTPTNPQQQVVSNSQSGAALLLPISSPNTAVLQQTTSSSSGPQTISSIINNQQQQQQQQSQQPIRLYGTQSQGNTTNTVNTTQTGKNINQASINELRKKTTVAGITALNQANSSIQQAQSINQVQQQQQQQTQQHTGSQPTLKQLINQKRLSEHSAKQQQQQQQSNNMATITITTPTVNQQQVVQQAPQQQQQQQKLIPTLSMPIQLQANTQTILARQASNQTQNANATQPTMILTANPQSAQQTQQINQAQQQQQQQSSQKPNTTSILIRQHPQIQQLTGQTTNTAQNTAKNTNQPQNTVQIAKPIEQTTITTQPIQVQASGNAATTTPMPTTTTTTTITKINTPNNSGGQVFTVTPSISNTQSNNIGQSQISSTNTNQPTTTFTTVIKPINSVTLVPSQQKQGIISTNQPQQFRQIQLMTTSTGSNNTSSNQTPTQVVIQQPGQSASQAIRKVGSSTNISTLQQKVQVFNRAGIQIVPSNAAQRLTTKTTNVTTTGGSANSASNAPVQLQQVIQQQANKQQPNQSSTSSTTINIQGLGSGINTVQTIMTSANTVQTKPQITSSAPTTVKSLLANSSQTPIISITTTSAGLNTGTIQQAVPINLNSSLSQVLRQFSTVQPITTTTLSTPTQVTLIQAAPSTSNTSINETNQSIIASDQISQNVNTSESSTNLSASNSEAQSKENK